MGSSVNWRWFAALSCLLCMGGEVRCDCTEEGMEIEDGNYTLTRQLETDSKLIYKCDKGFFPYPYLIRTCQFNGKWRPPPPEINSPQKCKLIECPDPTVIENGDVDPPQTKYYVGNETTYECYSGYRLQGSYRRVCLPNAKWSGYTPICTRDTGAHCTDPGVPPGASKSGSGYRIGDKIQYTCIGKMFLMGSKERTCLENRQWTGTEPECYYKHTYDSAREVAQAFGSSLKSDLDTLASTEVIQEGRVVKITANGTLNIYIAVDMSGSITKENITAAKNVIEKLVSKIAVFSTSPNYEIIFFSSEIHEMIDIIEYLGEGVDPITVKTKLEEFDVDEQNTAGTDLTRVFDHFWGKMSFIKERVGAEKFKTHRHVIILFTDGAYNLGGLPTASVQRIKNMVYMDHAVGDNHPRAEFLDIYVFGTGVDVFDEDLQQLTTGTGGRHYFRMDNINDLRQVFKEMIDDNDVKGLCGLHKELDEDSYGLMRDVYPWWAYITIKRDGSTTYCLGSLVTPKFVLTAAHCFPPGTTHEQITVEIDDGSGRVKDVQQYFPHPDYDVFSKRDQGVPEFYDYDVALVLLAEAVQITYESRPICLPCTVETNVALRLPPDATCEQQEQLLLRDRTESVSFLSKIKGKIINKDTWVHLGNSRPACISGADKPSQMTAPNWKDIAVTENFMCSALIAGHPNSVSCKGDSGGAVFKDHNGRTVQVAVVSWGNTEKCIRHGKKNKDKKKRDFFIDIFKIIPFLKSILGNDSDDYTSITFL